MHGRGIKLSTADTDRYWSYT